MSAVLRKDQLEKSLHDEKKLIQTGKLKDDNPLDTSPAFTSLCNAARRGDLKVCQEAIQAGANLNASDEYNYTPLILASLCGHYEVVQLLLESGALCERDTFQGERCLYNALNDRIRNLLLAYDYSKSTDPLQPFASHLYSLLSRTHPVTSDITVTAGNKSFALHKFVLAARSPYFRRKLTEKPETTVFTLPGKLPAPAFEIAINYLYLGEIRHDIAGGTGYSEEEVLAGIDRLARLLETQNLIQRVIEGEDRRIQRQQRQAEVERGRTQIDTWFRENVLKHKIELETNKASQVKWSKDNAIFADVLLRADEEPVDDLTPPDSGHATPEEQDNTSGIPIGPRQIANDEVHSTPGGVVEQPKSVLFPVHRAMLLRSEYFSNMFSSAFLEAQQLEHLRVIPVACTPAVLEHILLFLYGERADFGLQLAIDVLFAADMLLIERLKTKAAVIIGTLGNGVMTTQHPAATPHTDPFLPPARTTQDNGAAISDEEDHNEEDPLDPYATLQAAWDLRVPRLETFAARYFAYRLERYIEQEQFRKIIQESAARIKGRQETDSIELIDDIRYYLSERFRLRFEGDGIEELLNEDSELGGAVDRKAAGLIRTVDVQDGSTGNLGNGNGRPLDETLGMHEMNLEHRSGPQAIKPTALPAHEQQPAQALLDSGQVIRTLNGEIAGDEFAADALNYQILMGKIDALLDELKLDA